MPSTPISCNAFFTASSFEFWMTASTFVMMFFSIFAFFQLLYSGERRLTQYYPPLFGSQVQVPDHSIFYDTDQLLSLRGLVDWTQVDTAQSIAWGCLKRNPNNEWHASVLRESASWGLQRCGVAKGPSA
jgi:hypothetical protein